jgi:hypothetical protein
MDWLDFAGVWAMAFLAGLSVYHLVLAALERHHSGVSRVDPECPELDVKQARMPKGDSL